MTLHTRVKDGLDRLVVAVNALKTYTDAEIASAIADADTAWSADIATASTADRNADNHTSGNNN